jgi:hypothetical protein
MHLISETIFSTKLQERFFSLIIAKKRRKMGEKTVILNKRRVKFGKITCQGKDRR